MTLEHQYWLSGSSRTIHVTPTCGSARAATSLVLVTSPHPPEVVWDLLWHNHHLQAGVLTPEQVAGYGWGAEPVPALGDARVSRTGEAVDQDGYGVTRWGCLHCLESEAMRAGWTNLWPPDPERRHR